MPAVRNAANRLLYEGKTVVARSPTLALPVARLRGHGEPFDPGVDIVIEATGLMQALKGADLAITGEGRVDSQTPFGKTPAGVAKAAKRMKVPVVAIGGALADDAADVFKHGIHGLAAAAARDMDLTEAIAKSADHLANAAERVIRLIRIGKDMNKLKRHLRRD